MSVIEEREIDMDAARCALSVTKEGSRGDSLELGRSAGVCRFSDSVWKMVGNILRSDIYVVPQVIRRKPKVQSRESRDRPRKGARRSQL